MYSNRVYGAEIVLDDTCRSVRITWQTPGGTSPADLDALAESCDVLGKWDRKVELDSRGAQVFTEYWSGIRRELGKSLPECGHQRSLLAT